MKDWEREDELVRSLFYKKISPNEAKQIAQELLRKERLKNGNLIFLIEILHEYELEGEEWAKELKLKAIKKLKKVHPKSETEKRYIQRVIEEYDR
jgi:hypothetical protein